MAGFIDQIKLNTGHFLLKRNFNRNIRNRELVNLNLSENIGIICHINNEAEFKQFNKLVKELTTNRRKVLLIGFVDHKEIPDYCVVAGPGYYFSQQDINWLGIPKNDYILKFMGKNLDILIDLTRDDNFTTQYIVALSKAKLKAGQQSSVKEPYLDVMINMDNSHSMNDFIAQTLHYLSLLKNRQNG